MYQLTVRLYERTYGYTAYGEYGPAHADGETDVVLMTAHCEAQLAPDESAHTCRMRAARSVCYEIAQNLDDALF